MSVDVEVHYRHWSGSHQVSAEDSEILVVEEFKVNGMTVNESIARLVMDGPTLTLEVGLLEGRETDFRRIAVDQVRSHFTEHDWMEQTTDDLLVLPVSRIQFVELSREELYANS